MNISKFIFILLFFAVEALTASTAKVDSLLVLLEEQLPTLNLEEIHDIHHALGSEYVKDELYETAVAHFKKGLKIAKQLQHSDKIAKNLFNLGFSKDRRTEYSEAMQYYSELINLNEIEESNQIKVRALSQVSSIHQALGNYDKAFEFQMKALRLNEINNDKEGIARSYYMLGTIFFYQKQFEKALEQYEKSKVICDELSNQRDIYSCLAALGSVHAELGNSDETLSYNDQSLKLAQKLNYKMGIAYSLGNIGSSYHTQGNCKKAEEYVKKALKLKSELNDNWGVLGSKMSLVQIYRSCKTKEWAILPLMKEVIEMSQQMDAKPRELEAYKILIDFYDQQNNIADAYFYQNKYLALKDTILNEKTVAEMGKSQRRYEIEKKEHQISMLKKENELLSSNKRIQKLQIYIFAIIGLLFVLLSIWYFSRLKFQRNINKLLGEKNNLLNSKNEEIAIKNKQLEYSNKDLQQFAYVASHDLKEPLRMINSYTTLLKRKYNDQIDETGKEFMHFIVDAVGRMQTLLDDLLDYSRCGTQKLPDKLVDVSDVMILVEANLRHRLESNNCTLVIKKENLPAIKAHRSQLIQLLQNLVSNGLKFKGESDPIVVVDCQKKENHYIFSVQDNGIGISEANREKVFEMFKRLHTREEYEGTGIGLATCKRIVSNIGGDIWAESEEGKGSTFFFSISCPKEELVLA